MQEDYKFVMRDMPQQFTVIALLVGLAKNYYLEEQYIVQIKNFY